MHSCKHSSNYPSPFVFPIFFLKYQDRWHRCEIDGRAGRVVRVNHPQVAITDHGSMEHLVNNDFFEFRQLIEDEGFFDVFLAGGTPCQDVSLVNANRSGVFGPKSGVVKFASQLWLEHERLRDKANRKTRSKGEAKVNVPCPFFFFENAPGELTSRRQFEDLFPGPSWPTATYDLCFPLVATPASSSNMCSSRCVHDAGMPSFVSDAALVSPVNRRRFVITNIPVLDQDHITPCAAGALSVLSANMKRKLTLGSQTGKLKSPMATKAQNTFQLLDGGAPVYMTVRQKCAAFGLHEDFFYCARGVVDKAQHDDFFQKYGKIPTKTRHHGAGGGCASAGGEGLQLTAHGMLGNCWSVPWLLAHFLSIRHCFPHKPSARDNRRRFAWEADFGLSFSWD